MSIWQFVSFAKTLTILNNGPILLRDIFKSSSFVLNCIWLFQYLVRNDAAGYIMYIGDKGTMIEYSPELREWHMRSLLHPDVSAFSKAMFNTLAIGVHSWMVTDDIECQEGTAMLTLSLSSCNMRVTHPRYLYHKNEFTNHQEEFICHDRLCIDLGKRCNGIPDCQVMILHLMVRLLSEQ